MLYMSIELIAIAAVTGNEEESALFSLNRTFS